MLPIHSKGHSVARTLVTLGHSVFRRRRTKQPSHIRGSTVGTTNNVILTIRQLCVRIGSFDDTALPENELLNYLYPVAPTANTRFAFR